MAKVTSVNGTASKKKLNAKKNNALELDLQNLSLESAEEVLDAIFKHYEKIELAAKPNSYFIPVDHEQVVERSKRSDIKKVLNLDDESDDDLNNLASALFMPGSDLTPLKETEVEIARMSFETTVGNAYSLRADCASEMIAYSLVAEMAEFEIQIPLTNSKQPLTLKEVILQFEKAEPAIGLSDLIFALQDEGPVNLGSYIRASSAYYSGFKGFYDSASEKLLSAYQKKLDEQDEDVGQDD